MNRISILNVVLIFLLVSCNGLGNKAKQTINKGGKTVGKTATEFIEGVKEGVDQTLQCHLSISKELIAKGIGTGKYFIADNPKGGKHNVLTIYLIFNKDFNASVMARAFDPGGLEIGRARLDITGKAGDAGYYDFDFDRRTYLENKSSITLE